MSSTQIERPGYRGFYELRKEGKPIPCADVRNWVIQFSLREGDRDLRLQSRRQLLRDFLNGFQEHVLFEDDDILIINKPAGIISHCSSTQPIGVEEIAQYLRGEEIALVHRLDIETSGVLALAKGEEAFFGLVRQFRSKRNRCIEKKYLAIVEGEFPSMRQFYVRTALAPDGWKMKVVRPGNRESGVVESTTYFKPMVAFDREDGGRRSLVEVQTFTGKKHQIRVVCAQCLAHPVVGDYLYDPNYSRDLRVMLHAHLLGFSHPRNGRRLFFSAPVPEDFLSLIK